MKTVLIICSLFLLNGAFAQERRPPEITLTDLDGDGRIDTVYFENNRIICRLSSQNYKIIQSQELHIGMHDGIFSNDTMNGFGYSSVGMRAGGTFYFQYAPQTKRMQIAATNSYQFGNASNDGSGEASFNLLTNEYTADWNYLDHERNLLIKIPTIRTRLDMGDLYLENFPGNMDNYWDKSVELYQTHKEQTHKAIYAQLIKDCKDQVADINRQPLYKKVINPYLDTENDNDTDLTVLEYEKMDVMQLSYLYFDEQGKIRKFIHMINLDMFDYGYSVHYFDQEGQTVLSIFNEHSPESEERGLRGRQYWEKEVSIHVDAEYATGSGPKKTVTQDVGVWEGLPSPFDELSNTDKLRRFLTETYGEEFEHDNTCRKVRFLQPQPGETTIVNVRKANIRQTPSLNGDIITHLPAGHQIEIVEQNGQWYKIETNKQTGYIHQDSVEWIEHFI